MRFALYATALASLMVPASAVDEYFFVVGQPAGGLQEACQQFAASADQNCTVRTAPDWQLGFTVQDALADAPSAIVVQANGDPTLYQALRQARSLGIRTVLGVATYLTSGQMRGMKWSVPTSS